MLIFLVLSALSQTALEVDAQQLTGRTASGELVALSSDKMVLRTAGGEEIYDLTDLLAVTPLVAPKAPTDPDAIQVRMVDGSLCVANRYTVKKGKAQIELSNGALVDIPVRAIDSVRWKTSQKDFDQQWRALQDADLAGDVVVVRKTTSLDYYEGVLYDITADTVKFEFDGSRIDVRSSKVEGVIYFHATARELPQTICRVKEGNGSQWNAKSLLLTDDHLELITPSGVKVAILLDHIFNLDFSLGKIVYLSDMTPDDVTWKPYIGPGAIDSQLSQLFMPRNDRSFGGEMLTINNKSYSRGLALHSRTTLLYRLPENFRLFLADVGIDDHVGEAGHVRLVISGDGKQLLEAVVTGKDKQPLQIKIPIDGVRRLTILVDYGEELDIGDHLNLCNARITK